MKATLIRGVLAGLLSFVVGFYLLFVSEGLSATTVAIIIAAIGALATILTVRVPGEAAKPDKTPASPLSPGPGISVGGNISAGGDVVFGNQSTTIHGAAIPRKPAAADTASRGALKVVFCQRLGDSWRDLADVLDIPTFEQRRFSPGDEGRAIWAWLENRASLGQLPGALQGIGRGDLAQELAGLA